MLAVFVSPNEAGFGVVAVASPLGKSAIDRLSSMQIAEKVYDDHSHEIIGQYKSLRRAISSAEKFRQVRLWSHQKAPRSMTLLFYLGLAALVSVALAFLTFVLRWAR